MGSCYQDVIVENGEEYHPIICIDLNLETFMKRYQEFNYRLVENSQVLFLKGTENMETMNYPASWGIKYKKTSVYDFPMRCHTGVTSQSSLLDLIPKNNSSDKDDDDDKNMPKKVNLCIYDPFEKKVSGADYYIEGHTIQDKVLFPTFTRSLVKNADIWGRFHCSDLRKRHDCQSHPG